jgi:hypothetical protein
VKKKPYKVKWFIKAGKITDEEHARIAALQEMAGTQWVIVPRFHAEALCQYCCESHRGRPCGGAEQCLRYVGHECEQLPYERLDANGVEILPDHRDRQVSMDDRTWWIIDAEGEELLIMEDGDEYERSLAVPYDMVDLLPDDSEQPDAAGNTDTADGL